MRKKILTLIMATCIFLSGCNTSTKQTDTNKQDSKNSKYTWIVKPTIEADEIWVADDQMGKYNLGEYKYQKSDLAIIERNGKYGIVDYNGDVLVECKGDAYRLCECGVAYITDKDYNSITVDNDGKEVKIIDEHGSEWAGYQFKQMKDFDQTIGFHDYLFAAKKNGKWGYFDENNYEITDCIFFDMPAYSYPDTGNPVTGFSGNLVAVKTDEGCGYYTREGKKLFISGDFEETKPVQNGLAWVKDKKTQKWGVIKIASYENSLNYIFMHLPDKFDDEGNLSEGTQYQEESNYKELYEEFLKECESTRNGVDINDNYCRYYVYDFENDGTPEILVEDGTCEGDRRIEVFGIRDGKVKSLGNFESIHTGLVASDDFAYKGLPDDMEHNLYTYEVAVSEDTQMIVKELIINGDKLEIKEVSSDDIDKYEGRDTNYRKYYDYDDYSPLDEFEREANKK